MRGLWDLLKGLVLLLAALVLLLVLAIWHPKGKFPGDSD